MSTKIHLGIEIMEKKFGPMTLGMFLQAFRESDGQSQKNFARKLGLSRANLCDLEKGRTLASAERAAKIAKKMRVPAKLLIQLAIQDQLRSMKLNYTVHLKAG
ncbi:MAG: helix-turn-helix transcriptional regulator [Bdellovibrionales bacterium]|nr:helix-turn-helix transcriptional regulator [Bdellovibrionales bacterium]